MDRERFFLCFWWVFEKGIGRRVKGRGWKKGRRVGGEDFWGWGVGEGLRVREYGVRFGERKEKN